MEPQIGQGCVRALNGGFYWEAGGDRVRAKAQ